MISSVFLIGVLLHPFHVSFAEAQWNSDSQRFELAMRFDPHDLAKAVSLHAKQRVDLEDVDSKPLQQQLMRYVNEKFLVVDEHEQAATWHWVGMENEIKHVWLYLELQPGPKSQQLDITNTLLHEVASSQVNTVVLKPADAGDRPAAGVASPRMTLRFSRAQPTASLVKIQDAWQVRTQKSEP